MHGGEIHRASSKAQITINTMKPMHLFTSLFILMTALSARHVHAQTGFVKLPDTADALSAYVVCNPTGKYGLASASIPTENANNACAVMSPELNKSPLNAPLENFRLVGMLVSDVVMPAPYAGEYNAVAVLTDAIWRNKENTECILGTHLEMKDAPLANGQYWEVTDIVRGGFAGKDVAIAYFYKPHSQNEGGNTEVLFRAGRTFTSVATESNTALPSIKNAPSADTAISYENAAAWSDNWVNFTTDVSFKDADVSTRATTSIFYIHYDCDARDPSSRPNAIHLRTTNQHGQKPLDIALPGLVPADGLVEQF